MKKSDFFLSPRYNSRHGSSFLNNVRSKSFNNNIDLSSFKDENNNMLYYPAPVCQKYSRKISKKKTISNFKENETQDETINLQSTNLPEPPLLKEKEINYKLIEKHELDITYLSSKINIKILGRKKKKDIDIIKKNFQLKKNKNEEIYSENNENVDNEVRDIKIQTIKIRISPDTGNHNKYSEDNMMRKIKAYFFTYCHNFINKSIKDKKLQFLKIYSSISENLKKDFNLDLLNRTFKDIYQNSSISKKYKKERENYISKNKEIIQKIYEEKKEIETINILNLTYRELFSIFRRSIIDISLELKMKIEDIALLENEEFNNINKFFEQIEQQEISKKESNEDIKNYIDNIKQLCINYEKWFMSKKGRNRIKNKK